MIINKGYKSSDIWKLIVLMFLVLFFNNSNGQETRQKLPNVEINDVFNWSSDIINFNDFKGKLIILDFWGVYCGSCIQEFPKLDSIQKRFNNDIQIFTVINLDKDSVIRFFNKNKHINIPNVPFITNDTLLNNLFPHRGLPHHIWIDKNGDVLYEADSFNFTAENIESVLKNNGSNIMRSRNVNYVDSFFDEKWKGLTDYSSTIARATYESGMRLSGNLNLEKSKSLTYSGTIEDLYITVYENITNGAFELKLPDRVVLELTNKDRYKIDDKLTGLEKIKWIEENFYYYQLIVPSNLTGNLHELMLEDLNRYFNVSATIEKKKVNFLTLAKTSINDKLRAQGKSGQLYIDSYDDNNVNKSFVLFIEWLKPILEKSFQKTFYNDIEYLGNIDFDISPHTINDPTIEEIKSVLNTYNLEIVEREIDINVLVLRDN